MMTDQAPTTPDSVVVPVEPTEAMTIAGVQAWPDEDDAPPVSTIYRAMLAARPAATPGGEREAIARIIDPDAWIMTDHWRSLVNRPDLDQRIHERQQPSLVKADAILAALSRPAPEVVAYQREHPQSGWVDCAPEDVDHYRGRGQAIRALGVIQ